jgi:hypothetical protein
MTSYDNQLVSILVNVPKHGKLLCANLMSDGICIVKLER